MIDVKDFTPDGYEIVKFVTGNEVVAMTKDRGETLELLLPMTYWLQPKETTAKIGFYPYQPLSTDLVVEVFKSDILHRNALSEQFVPLYDKACKKWSSLLDQRNVPIVDIDDDLENYSKSDMDYVNEILNSLTGKNKKGPIH